MKWLAVVAALACGFVYAFSPGRASAQGTRDPLIVPQEGGAGTLFQVVGQSGWTPGETVTLQLALTPSDPFAYTGPFYHQRQVTVLRDGTWSFPIVVNDDLFPFPLGTTPGFIVVQAVSASKTATNAFVFAPGGHEPAGASAIAHLGFGPAGAVASGVLTAALFIAATGGLLVASGALRET